MSWGMIAFQAWLIFLLLPNALPGKTLVGIIFCGIYFLIPGFRLLNWIPPYDDIRAPYDFFQITGPVFTIASAALMLRIIISSDKNKYIFPFRKTAVNFILIALVLLGWVMDVKIYARPLWKSPLSNELYEGFLETCEYLKNEKDQGWLYPVSGRYFYQMIPVLSGVPLAQEAFNGYLQPKNTAALQTYFLSRDHHRAFFNIAGITYILLDKTDPELSESYKQILEGYFEESFSNDYFTVLKNPDSTGGAFIANEIIELASEDTASLSDGLLAALDNQLALNFDGATKSSAKASDIKESDDIKSLENARFTPLKLKERSYKKLIPEKASDAGYLVAVTSWHPDWTVSVNGKKTSISRALNAFPAVAVQAGDEVVFEFQPPAWYSACLWGALGSWVVLPLIVCFPASWRKLRGEVFTEMPARAFSVQRPLVVIPTYNEVDCITDVLTLALSADERIEVLVVDDASPDGTAEKIKAFDSYGNRVHLLERP
ncbi:MAG: glycosyltransferase, partial [Chthoniobacterales bacterium]